MMARKHKYKRHKEHKAHKKRVPPYMAIIILLIITIGASASAFLWLSRVKEYVELPRGLIIEQVDYDSVTHDMFIRLFNGEGKSIPVRTLGKVTEQTIITIYPPDASSIGCNFIPLSKLECDPNRGVCDEDIAPEENATIKLDGARNACLITGSAGDQFHLDIRFGNKAETYTDFMLG